jgi:hypothetical protein
MLSALQMTISRLVTSVLWHLPILDTKTLSKRDR